MDGGDETRFRFIVTQENDGERIDRLLHLLAGSFSRTRIQRLIREERVLVNGQAVKASAAVSEGDDVLFLVPPVREPALEAQEIPLDILYEDEDLLVVNKPKGMVVHPAPGHTKDTLVNAVLAHCGKELSGIGGVLRPGIVHRIDKDTTGSVLVCKNDAAHLSIAAQLKAHTVGRIYHAIVYGLVKEEYGTVAAPIGRSASDRKKMAVDFARGKSAVTHYEVRERFANDKMTYLTCRLETGRTHQIRVHMASIGHPLLGDPLYAGGRKSRFSTEGQCLHAETLVFTQPRTGERIETRAPLPAYFQALLEGLR